MSRALTPANNQHPALKAPPPPRSRRFISLRWRLLVPITTALLLVITIGAYVISNQVLNSRENEEIEDVMSLGQSLSDDAQRLGQKHRNEIWRLTHTGGVRENIAARNAVALQRLIEPNAMLAELDLIIVTANDGTELIGLQRTPDEDDYTIATQTDLSALPGIQDILEGTLDRTNSLILTETGLTVVTLEAVYTPTNDVMGTIAVGTRLESTIRSDYQLALFDAQGQIISTTFDQAPLLSPQMAQDILNNPTEISTEIIKIDGERYQAAHLPFMIESDALAVASIYQPSSTLATNNAARHIFGLTVALLGACTVILTYLFVARTIERLETIRHTARSLIDGETEARTGFVPTDEIGELAAALDEYADVVQVRTDRLVTSLERQQRATQRLLTIIESLPDGLIITDIDGRVLMMNALARELIGTGTETRNFKRLTAVITDTLGPALAPGIYAVGSPTYIPHQGRVLQTQTAAITSGKGQRVGLLIMVRNATGEAQRDQEYAALLDELASNVQMPIALAAQEAAFAATSANGYSDTLMSFARSMARHTRSMQRIITELRELSTFTPQDVEHHHGPIEVSELLWQIAAQWKTRADEAEMMLEIQIDTDSCYINGDERRLRWAIGNFVDNAIKYSLPGTVITITGHTDHENTYIQIIDQGLGIVADDMPHIFQRFFRGTPRLPDGTTITQPGTGQGLYLARKVIQAHLGQIELESQPYQGTVVHICLPRTPSV